MQNDQTYRTETHTHRHLVCWKSTFAGLALALVIFMGALALSLAFGGIGLEDGSSAQAAGTFAVGSIAIAIILATLGGGYLTARLGRTEGDALGTTQGLVVGALFLLAVMWQVTSAVGTLGKIAGQTVGASVVAAGAAGTMAGQNPAVQELVQDTLGDLKLRSDAATVAKGVGSRLLRGDEESAKAYLAYEAGIPASEVDQKIASAKAKMDEYATKAREATAKVMKATGWSIFLLTVLGMISAGLGGLLASKCNEKYTLDTHDELKKAYKRTLK